MSKLKTIDENWSKIKEVEERIREKTGDPNAGFNASYFFFDGVRKLMIPCNYKKPKGDGFTQKTYDMMVLAEYCPFTGKPLYTTEEE